MKLRHSAVLSVLVLCFFAAAARAEPPLWVIEDEDSTIYLLGTVHLLDPEIAWLTPRIEQALDAASEVWFEVPILATQEEMQAQQLPAMMRLAFSRGRPLSSLLTEQQQAQLRRALARTPAPEQLGIALEQMKPWFATLSLGVSPMLAAGYDAESGADVVLAKIARARGAAILGFETSDQQLAMFAGGTEDEQLTVLRDFLAVDDETFGAYLALSDAAFRAWMRGETAPLQRIIEDWKKGGDPLSAITPYDTMVANRNGDWAAQIVDLLAGKGIVFIAVGAGHLVGPDSVQVRLAAHGIAAERR